MKTEIKEIYKCEYCNKPYQRKHNCLNHEKICFKNPDTERICFKCIFLEKKDTLVVENTYCVEEERNINIFYCKKIDSYLYPPKVEHKKNKFETMDKENKPMLRICTHHKIKSS